MSIDRDFLGWLQYIESLPSGLYPRSLDRVTTVAKKLGVLNFAGKIITVAGSNGKSSCVIFLEAILLAANYKTGAYISPHVFHYNERIRLNGKEIDSVSLCQAFTLVEFACGDLVLSYSEFTTLVALVVFQQQELDFLLLEVGLGGRLDAVNILDSDIAVITTVSLEHLQVLGNTREAIGREKSGIIRPLQPVVCGAAMPDSVYSAAARVNAKLYSLHQDFSYSETPGGWRWKFAAVVMENLPQPHLPIASAALALMVINLLSGDCKITMQAITSGLKKAFLLGRWQSFIFTKKEIIFDVAHNPESAVLLAANLMKTAGKGRILAVASMLSDKDIVAILEPLKKIVARWYIGVINNIRAASAVQLAQCFSRDRKVDFILLPTVTASLRQAIAECQENDRIVVFGSFHTVREGLGVVAKF